jgi:hypothetical protein
VFYSADEMRCVGVFFVILGLSSVLRFRFMTHLGVAIAFVRYYKLMPLYKG